ncbi:MFS transporter [Sphingobacterium sp. SRCM116780]|uniref:MFS transporter n=1 Tax=Sphingobacterium sp. SRCM116780 TaxID=2907623 RepID=UPI001F428DEC|nr:MFS transporter [Sphingobacterium sp. SRCM116780]UIR57190.1 MFS transporter [Sphingobacterium sp. SRCM116780]
MHEKTKPTLTNSLLWLMTIATGLVVANNYYNQPLLALIAKDIQVSESVASNIAMLTQIGYACGLLFIVPLGDMFKRKRMILIDFVFIIIALIGMALSPNIQMLSIFSFFIGFTSVIPQVFVPMAAELASKDKQSSAIGMVMSGLLIGILLSRVISGFVGSWLGWREMYWIAAAIMLLTASILAFKLPELNPSFKGTYTELMKSIWSFAKSQPVLQLASFRGAMGFGSFSAFFTTLVFHLQGPPFFDGAAMAGSFGLFGACGALAAAFVNKFTVRYNQRHIITAGICIMLLSWFFFSVLGSFYIGLIIGIILIDLGLQSMHILNQGDFYALNLGANNRLNTVYMVSYFIGGASGTYFAAQAWQHYEWNGVIVVGLIYSIAALIAHLLFDKQLRNQTI